MVTITVRHACPPEGRGLPSPDVASGSKIVGTGGLKAVFSALKTSTTTGCGYYRH